MAVPSVAAMDPSGTPSACAFCRSISSLMLLAGAQSFGIDADQCRTFFAAMPSSWNCAAISFSLPCPARSSSRSEAAGGAEPIDRGRHDAHDHGLRAPRMSPIGTRHLAGGGRALTFAPRG